MYQCWVQWSDGVMMVILVMREHMLTMSDIGLNGRASGLGDEVMRVI